FEKQFVPQTELFAEQAFWSQNSVNSPEPTLSSRPNKVEVPKELPKVNVVNTSLKKLKHHLAGFDVVVKERTTDTTITEGSWGFKCTKACFRDEIIPFVKALKDLFNTFNQYLIDELSEVQNVFHQMKQAVEQHRLESKTFEVKMNQVLNKNERLLEQVISKDIVNIIVNSFVDNAYENVHVCEKCLKLETELQKDFIEKEIYDKMCPKLIAENEHLKQTYKQLYDSIKPTRIRSKENCDGLINQVNLKYVEISDLNASLREKVLVITALKDDLKKLKGKALCIMLYKYTLFESQRCYKIGCEPITPKLLNKRIAHSTYIKHTQEEVAVLRDLVEHVKSNYPLDHSLESACRYTKRIQELLTNTSQTCPSIKNSGEKLVAVTPKSKDKRVRFTEPITSSRNTKTTSSSNLVSNKPMLSSTGVRPSTSASGSQPSGNKKKNKIERPSSSTLKNKVEAHHRTVKSSLKHKNCVVKPKETANVQHSKINANSELLCVKCNGCMLSANHDLCVLDFINNVNARAKSKSVKKSSKRKVWKPTRKVFTNIGYSWRPTGRTFTIVRNACPLTRITTTAEVPLRKPTALECDTSKHVVTLVYSRKPRKSKTNVPVRKPKIIKSVSANKMEPSKSWGSIVFDVPSCSLNECMSVQACSCVIMDSALPAYWKPTGLVPNPPLSTPFVPPSRTDWDLLFQPLFDELLTPPPSVDCPAPEVIAPIAKVVAPEPAVSTGSPSSTTVDQDAPSPSNLQTTPETQSPVIPNDDVIPTVVQPTAPYSEHVIKWTKDNPLDNIIGELERPISTRLQLHEQALFCYYDAFLSSVEPKTYKDALTQSCWIEEMQEELNEFELLKVWKLVPRPNKVMAITLKWIYKVKLDEMGGILKNKALLVARGYRKEEGINFEESFA
ncbi:retrovirus-related pol polyprotein from transposon TNT 1-94, partial [Tanacetum coccineum]